MHTWSTPHRIHRIIIANTAAYVSLSLSLSLSRSSSISLYLPIPNLRTELFRPLWTHQRSTEKMRPNLIAMKNKFSKARFNSPPINSVLCVCTCMGAGYMRTYLSLFLSSCLYLVCESAFLIVFFRLTVL